MTDQPRNTAIVDGVRAFYEHAAQLATVEMPGTPWPGFDDLSHEQLRPWMLAYAATIEVAAHMTDAMLALELGA